MRRRFIYFILIISCSVLNVLADEDKMSFGDMVAALENVGESCKEKPTRDNIRDILFHKRDVDMSTKCFRRCLMEIFELHDPESTKMREETTLEFGGMMYPEQKDDFALILTTCNTRNEHIEDKCDAAHEHFACMFDEMSAKGFVLPEVAEE